MTQPVSVNPPTTPFLTSRGVVAPEWMRFFYSLNRNSTQAAAGEVATPPGSGLEGGGAVADGVDLSIATNGVTNAMLRQSAALSVMGRYANTAGNVGDITAVTEGSVLTRTDDVVSFTPYLDNIAIGTFVASPSVNTDSLRVNQTPTAEVVVCTHTIIVSVDGTDYKIPCVAA